MFATLARLFRPTPPSPQWLDASVLREQLAGNPAPLIVDVRGADEFDAPLGHTDAALNAPLPELGARRDEIIDASRPIICVCLTDKRSATAAARLSAAGLGNVAALRGMKAWCEAEG